MNEPLRILHLEDNLDDAILVRTALQRGGLDCDIKLTSSRVEFLDALENGPYDLIMSDSSVAGFDGPSALKTARQRFPAVPFIFVSGFQAGGVKRPAAGAADYVAKSQLDRLVPAIHSVLFQLEEKSASVSLDPQRRATERLVEVVQELSLARDLETIMAIVRHAARELTGADGATFVLRDGDLCHYADEDAIAPLWKGKRFPMSACISGWAMLNRKHAVIEDIYADPRIPADAYRPTFVKSLAMVPIRSSAPVGAIGNYWAEQHLATPEQLKLLQALANSTSIAMENVQLYNELERRIADRTAQLALANRELEAFSYSVSHDLRAPLRAIRGFGEQLAETAGPSLDAESRKSVERMRQAADRMDQLIVDLLKLSQVTQSAMEWQEIDLARLAGEIVADLQAAEPSRKVSIKIDEALSAQGDSRLLRIALVNLLSNAWKYSSKQAYPAIAVGCIDDAEGRRYFVRDNGAGFDMAYAQDLFGAFRRMHSEAEFPGTGIGLATVQRIIHRHGGRIWAEAAVGQGATFYFTLGEHAPISD